jgi:hypothetical protein
MKINIPKLNLSHIYNKHQITEETILNIINDVDVVTRTSNNVKYYYKDDNVVIVVRGNKNMNWYVKTAYQNNKDFLLGEIIYQKEDKNVSSKAKR